ncbi:zinc finger, CCHC-type containing protein, partial [Tanacetum coccineum]
HAEFDESDTHVLERLDTSAGNYVKEILLKLNLPDHKILKDGGEVKEFQRSFRHSDTERLSQSDEVLKLKNFKKDATLKLFKSTNQERYEHVGPEVTSSQDGQGHKMAKKRLCLVDDLKRMGLWIWHIELEFLMVSGEVQTRIRRIFFVGYDVLGVRTIFFKYLRLSSKLCAFMLIFTKSTIDIVVVVVGMMVFALLLNSKFGIAGCKPSEGVEGGEITLMKTDRIGKTKAALHGRKVKRIDSGKHERRISAISFKCSIAECLQSSFKLGVNVKLDDTMNEDTPVGVAFAIKEVVTPSMVDMMVEMEKISSLEDTIVPESFPPLTTPVTTTAGNAPGKSSYANITGKPSGKKVNVHNFFAPEVNGIDVVIPADSIRAISERFANTAYDGLYSMLENGPWFIWNNPLILKKWHPDENLLKEDVSIVPVWVKFHGVPITAFSEDGLSAIATKLGTRLMLDSYTSDMCMQSWGRSSYARVMIELRADVELKDNIVVAMPKITREGHYTCNVHVEYE